MFGKLLNWMPIILKSVVLVEAITGLDGPTKKEKAMGLTVGFLGIMAENITDSAKEEIGGLIDETVGVLNAEGIFDTSGHPDEEEEETEEEETEEEEEPPVLGASKPKKKTTKKKG